jgi:hypothetical protein
MTRSALSLIGLLVLLSGSFVAYDYLYRRPLRREANRRFTINRVAIDENNLLHESFADDTLA